MKNNIVLTGFMASGKSAVGKELAKRLGMDFVDSDELIEEKEGIKISQIFREKESPILEMSRERSLRRWLNVKIRSLLPGAE